MPKNLSKKRNDVLFDRWSIVHLCFGIALGWFMSPAVAIAVLVLWEPIEIFLLSPLLAQVGVVFGFETLKNSLSDIIFDTIGVLLGSLILQLLATPPFHLF